MARLKRVAGFRNQASGVRDFWKKLQIDYRGQELNSRGDTLVEVTIALAILSMVMATSFKTANKAFQLGQNAKERTIASNLIQQQAEGLRNWRDYKRTDWNALKSSIPAGAIPGSSTCAGGNCFTMQIVGGRYQPVVGEIASGLFRVFIIASFLDPGDGSDEKAEFTIIAIWERAGGGEDRSEIKTYLYSIQGLEPENCSVTCPGQPGPNRDPVVAFTATPDRGPAPLTVTINATITEPDADPITCIWNFGDGTPDDTACHNGVAFTHTYTAFGDYTLSLTVSDDQGGTGMTSQLIRVVRAGLVSTYWKGHQDFDDNDGFSDPFSDGLGPICNINCSYIDLGAISYTNFMSDLLRIRTAQNRYAGGGNNQNWDDARFAAVKFRGFITVPTTGNYRFCGRFDDGMRVRVGATEFFNNLRDSHPATFNGQTDNCAHRNYDTSSPPPIDRLLNAGTPYPLEVDYTNNWYQNEASSEFELYYMCISGCTIAKSVVPASAFTHELANIVNTGIKPPVYRLYNRSNDDHFYTISAQERDRADQNSGYDIEGIEFYAYTIDSGPEVPIYRYYNGSNGDHFYTRTSGSYSGYIAESIAFYAYDSTGAGRIPVYRLWHPSLQDHFYTTSASERSSAMRSGYQDEGIEFYAPN